MKKKVVWLIVFIIVSLIWYCTCKLIFFVDMSDNCRIVIFTAMLVRFNYMTYEK